MANTSRVNGFRPVRNIYGAPYAGEANIYAVPTSNTADIAVGDFVKLAGTASTMGVGPYMGQTFPDVARFATAGTDVIVGAVVGIVPDPAGADGLTNLYLSGADSRVRLVLVADNPSVLFEVEADDTTGIVAADIGLNANVVLTSNTSTTTGASGMQLDSSTIATTNTLDLKIINFVNRADNEIGQYDKVLVRINRHQYSNQVAGV